VLTFSQVVGMLGVEPGTVADNHADPGTTSDIGQLRDRHPEWVIGVAWATANSGADYRMLTASRGGVQVSAATAAELSGRIAEAEQLHGWSS
jgi:hypothetical protein